MCKPTSSGLRLLGVAALARALALGGCRAHVFVWPLGGWERTNIGV